MSEPLVDITQHDVQTLHKVREGLEEVLGVTNGRLVLDAINAMQNRGILFREPAADEAMQRASDGFHTIHELYTHRRALTSVLATIAAIDCDSWRSKRHHPDDGDIFAGYFLVGIELPGGPISYHYPVRDWDLFAAVPELEHAPKWDGHTADEVVARLDDFAVHLKAAIDEGRAAAEQNAKTAEALAEMLEDAES